MRALKLGLTLGSGGGDFYIIPYTGDINYSTILNDALIAHKKVQLGTSSDQVFRVSKASYLNSDNILRLKGNLKLFDAVIQNLVSDVAIGSYTAEVEDGTEYKVGDYIAISDNNQPVVGGGAGQTRKMALARKATNIVGNIVHFAEASDVAFSAASGGTVGTCNSVLIANAKTNVSVIGTGYIDGNKANQYNHGFWKVGGMEEVFASHGICFRDCTTVNMTGITVKDCNLHDVTTWNTSYVTAYDIHLQAADNKNWLLYQTSHFSITNSSSDDAEYEDGFVLYYGNSYGIITNCTAENNGRLGLGINSTNSNIIVNGFTSTNNGQPFFIGLSHDIEVNNMYTIGGGVIRHNTTTPYRPVDISASHDIVINGLYADGSALACNEMIAFRGDTYNVTINEGYSKNTLSNTGNGQGYALIIGDLSIPHDIVFNDFEFSSLKTAMGNYNDTTDRLVLNRCTFANNTNYGTLRDSVKFYDCIGIVTYVSGEATFTSALTQKFITVGIPYVGAIYRPVATRFALAFKDGDGGNASTISIGSVSTQSANNARIDLNTVPGKTIIVEWNYDINRR